MYIGMPTLIETAAPRECAALCRQLGLSFVELNMNLPQYQPLSLDVPALRTLAAEYGIFYTIHLDENCNVCDFNPYVADAYLRTVLETIGIARALGAPLLNMHLSSGVYFTLPDHRVYLFEEYRERYLADTSRFIDACEAEIGDSGIRICIENTDGYTALQREALSLYLQSPCFALTYDIGHDHCAGGGDGDFIRAHADRLCHMHIHDAVCTPKHRQNHMIPGEGELDLPAFFALAASHDCTVVLETKTAAGLAAAAAWMRTHLP